MPISEHDQPVYTIACSLDHCTGPTEGTPAVDADGYVRYFDSERAAREWAETEGWSTGWGAGILCPTDVAELREAEDQAAEVAAAIQHAMGLRPS